MNYSQQNIKMLKLSECLEFPDVNLDPCAAK